ncbi:hypothetical protein [Sinorhizobium meliloti]|uniref:hypothetical protein n=1 Tax=Rhizobium meliloti TaxID=382 RepID=UPI000FD8FF67|nr:hypothetical protein [Sinorhizobium meliloti]RVK16942.1 hypothetical protein CN164_03250 [Sinorhizobium meliloti]
MAFWNWGTKVESDKPTASVTAGGSVEKAWQDASAAMTFYLDFRETYNVPFTPERWRDDFALGFRDGICLLHFQVLNDIPKESDAMFLWNMMVIKNDEALQEAWMKTITDNGGYTERAESGMQAAMILESWRLKRECIRGGLEYVAREEREYRERHPDATQFNIEHWLILSHFVLPLIDASKGIHPYLLDL